MIFLFFPPSWSTTVMNCILSEAFHEGTLFFLSQEERRAHKHWWSRGGDGNDTPAPTREHWAVDILGWGFFFFWPNIVPGCQEETCMLVT